MSDSTIDPTVSTVDGLLNESLPCYVCSKCRKTIPSNLGGYTVHYTDSSNLENGTIECEDCCPPSPNTLKWIVQYQEVEAAAAAAAAEEARWEEEDGYSSNDYGLDDYDPNYDPANDPNFYFP